MTPCANTTLGLMSFWWLGTRQQQGRARIKIAVLPGLAILDPRQTGSAGRALADEIFRKLLPANEAYCDPVRMEFDRRALCDLLGLPETVLEPLALLRGMWSSEPSVHGGKSTRPPGC